MSIATMTVTSSRIWDGWRNIIQLAAEATGDASAGSVSQAIDLSAYLPVAAKDIRIDKLSLMHNAAAQACAIFIARTHWDRTAAPSGLGVTDLNLLCGGTNQPLIVIINGFNQTTINNLCHPLPFALGKPTIATPTITVSFGTNTDTKQYIALITLSHL